MNGEKISGLLRKYPFQSGIAIGVIVCLFLVGFLSLLFSPESGLSGGEAAVREDYLRMAIAEYADNADQSIASWRFSKVGRKARETLDLMKLDSSTDPLSLLSFSEAVNAADVFDNSSNQKSQVPGGTRKGLSKFAIMLFVILAVLIIGALILYFWSEKKTAEKQRKRVSKSDDADEKVMRVVKTSDFNTSDDYYNSDKVILHLAAEDEQIPEKNDVEDLQFLSDEDDSVLQEPEKKQIHFEAVDEISDDLSHESGSEDTNTDQEIKLEGSVDDEENSTPNEIKVETTVVNLAGLDEQNAEQVAAEEPNQDDEQLTEMIRSLRKYSSDLDLSTDETGSDDAEPEQESSDSHTDVANETESDEEAPLVHFQSVYQLGDDLFDETFSLEDGDVYLGECGIGIGETLNNSEPKAVTGFELWLFDRSDIHTPTNFLLSDFAMSNESILDRMKQKGAYERIKTNGKTEITTQSLRMLVTVLKLDYGSEMSEKNSYFNQVTFDIQIWKR